MRAVALAFALSVAAASLTAQEKPCPTESSTHREWPRLLVSLGKGEGFFVHRFSRGDQAEKVVANNLQTLSGDIHDRRFFITGQLTRWPGHSGVSGTALTGRMSPLKIGPLRPGVGLWWTQSSDTYDIAAGEGWRITNQGNHQMIAGIFDLGVGRYDRSYFRIAVMQGSAKTTDSVHVDVGGHPIGSPLQGTVSERSDFRAVQASGAFRHWGFSLEGSATGIQPQKTQLRHSGPGLRDTDRHRIIRIALVCGHLYHSHLPGRPTSRRSAIDPTVFQ